MKSATDINNNIGTYYFTSDFNANMHIAGPYKATFTQESVSKQNRNVN